MFNPKVPGYDDCAYGDNVVVNNIFYKNANVTDRTDKKGKTASRTTHIAFDWNATPEYGRLRNNVIFSGEVDAEVFYFCDAIYLNPSEPRNRSIRSFQQRYPDWFIDNVDLDPLFSDPEKGDFCLQPDSPCIDAGEPLTQAASSGQGRAVQVEDSLYFSDGYGITDPDVIRVGSQRVTIVRVVYDTNTVWLDRELSWSKGTPVTLDYEGNGLDSGAIEFRQGRGYLHLGR